ncbi:uncharacterized protein V1518DRAFT_413680 [Limtongia smithiae]|uniref:uncharacterized protein n=1 Tax=Limtongia smithiae TaxID=1125753 RepID=UPI0034CDA342
MGESHLHTQPGTPPDVDTYRMARTHDSSGGDFVDDGDIDDDTFSTADAAEATPSPPSTPPSITAAFDSDSDDLDELDDDNTSLHSSTPQEYHVSRDVRRLHRDHSQRGYLNGVTAGKPASVQKGFDAGYELGAHIGLTLGRVLGRLQGLRGLASAAETVDREIIKDLRALETAARDEILDDGSLHTLFGVASSTSSSLTPTMATTSAFWRQDPISGDIIPEWVTADMYAAATDYATIAACHPLVLKWTARIDEVVAAHPALQISR